MWKAKGKFLYQKKSQNSDWERKFRNLILAFLSLMSLCPVIKIVYHTQEIYRGFVFNVLLELFKKNIFPQTVLYKYRAQNT